MTTRAMIAAVTMAIAVGTPNDAWTLPDSFIDNGVTLPQGGMVFTEYHHSAPVRSVTIDCKQPLPVHIPQGMASNLDASSITSQQICTPYGRPLRAKIILLLMSLHSKSVAPIAPTF